MNNNSPNIIKDKLQLTSPVFSNNTFMPKKYTCDGENVNPPLDIINVPSNTKSLALIVDDPDAPAGTWNHWIKFNISPDKKTISEKEEDFGVSGKGTSGNLSYKGPCPPSGVHHYIFKLYALDTVISLDEGVTKKDLIDHMDGHIIDEAKLIGLYKR